MERQLKWEAERARYDLWHGYPERAELTVNGADTWIGAFEMRNPDASAVAIREARWIARDERGPMRRRSNSIVDYFHRHRLGERFRRPKPSRLSKTSSIDG